MYDQYINKYWFHKLRLHQVLTGMYLCAQRIQTHQWRISHNAEEFSDIST
jgi:hypothetical protein